MATHPYYTDPFTGRRTTRDTVVHRLALATDRRARWTEEWEHWQVKAETTRSASWRSRFDQRRAHAQYWRDRAIAEQQAWQQALTRGDGRTKDWQYRLSVSYTTHGKQGRFDRLQVDVILQATDKRRASAEEVRRVFREVFRTGTPPEGWQVKALTWWHEGPPSKREKAKPPQQVRTKLEGEDGIAVHIQQIFRKVFNADAGSETVGEERIGGRRGRSRYVVGEEAEDHEDEDHEEGDEA